MNVAQFLCSECFAILMFEHFIKVALISWTTCAQFYELHKTRPLATPLNKHIKSDFPINSAVCLLLFSDSAAGFCLAGSAPSTYSSQIVQYISILPPQDPTELTFTGTQTVTIHQPQVYLFSLSASVDQGSSLRYTTYNTKQDGFNCLTTAQTSPTVIGRDVITMSGSKHSVTATVSSLS